MLSITNPISSYAGPDANYYLQTFYPVIPVIKWSIASGDCRLQMILTFIFENHKSFFCNNIVWCFSLHDLVQYFIGEKKNNFQK